MRLRGVAPVMAAFGLAVIPMSTASAVGSEGDRQVVNRSSQECLAIGSADPTAGKPAIQWTCEVGHSEQTWAWVLIPGATSTYTLSNEATGKCLAIGSASHSAGAQAIQWPCELGHTEQQWIYDSAKRLRNKESQLC